LSLPSGVVALNWRKLPAAPFQYLSKTHQEKYFASLQALTAYLVGLSAEQFSRIVENKFVFCFLVWCQSFKVSSWSLLQWSSLMERIAYSQLRQAEGKLERSLGALFNSNFERNEDYLNQLYYAGKKEHPFAGINFNIFIEQLSTHFNSLQDEGEELLFQFFNSLIEEFYKSIDFDMGLNCNYFLYRTITGKKATTSILGK
jgi:hypothetical protein